MMETGAEKVLFNGFTLMQNSTSGTLMFIKIASRDDLVECWNIQNNGSWRFVTVNDLTGGSTKKGGEKLSGPPTCPVHEWELKESKYPPPVNFRPGTLYYCGGRDRTGKRCKHQAVITEDGTVIQLEKEKQ